MTYKLLLVVFLFIVSFINRSAHGQSGFVNIIPPTPTASAMQQYGNTNVGLYTGAANVSVPIHTIKLKELQFPITLSYSGSGGINIQTVASWVGLGWTLSSGGAVSRTIYGLADDKPNYGYLYQPAIPVPTTANGETFENFANGMTDGEPDKYFYNAGGVSGSFYLNKQKQVVQVPLTNNKIIPEFDLLGKIIAFDVLTDKGIAYNFSEHEESRSYVPGGNSTDNNFYVSSWYLSSVRNFNNTEAIYFHYEGYSFNQTSEYFTTRIIDNPGSVFLPRYSITETNAKRLKYITYNQGDTIEFVVGSLPRRDLTGEKFLAAIEIKERDLVRSVDFSYSYFEKNGVVPITSTGGCIGPYPTSSLINGQTDGDNCKRLKLDSVVFFNAAGTGKLPYTFEYYTQTYLPHRFSYARDHWGYYNGQDNNPGLEPRQKVDRRPIASHLRGADFAIYGNANREPSAIHAKAGMLTKINYPTGGSTVFDYELHQSPLKLLPNQKQSLIVGLDPLMPKDTIQLETINDPFVDVRVTVMGIPLTEFCDFTVTFRNIQTGAISTLGSFFEGQQTVGGPSQTIFLEEGDYEISYTEHDGVGNCFEEFYTLQFYWQNEVSTTNKDVGGLRIKKTIDISGLGDSVKRVYNYTLQDSTISSGSLVSVPRYGYYETGYLQGQIIAFYRMYNTNTPLALTQGSHVGYKRVEVTTEQPQKTGKSIYYYSSPADFPDFTRGWTTTKYDDQIVLNNGTVEHVYVFPHHDNRDWKRGLLFAQVDFAFLNDQFVRISSMENHFKVYGEIDPHFDLSWQNNYPTQVIEPEYNKDEFFTYGATNGENIPKLHGVRTQCNYGEGGVCGFLYVKNYEFFSGRIELISQTQKSYHGQNSLTAGTKFTYGNGTFYYPTITKSSTSRGDSIITTLKYPFDRPTITNLSTTEKAALDSLVSVNAVADPVEKIITRGSTEIERQRTNYMYNSNKIWRDNVFSSSAGGTLEQVFDFVAYDADGNVLEYKGRDGIPVTIKYGYNNQLPVAKVVNAHHTQVFHESFEQSGTAGISKTGKKYHSGDYTVNLSTALPGSVLSYWYWQSNAWHFKQVSYSAGNYTITDGDRIDEVRIHPPGALMTTYTYSPGIGTSSASDQMGLVISYEYDSFGRLRLVKDYQGNVLQQVGYNIVGQQ